MFLLCCLFLGCISNHSCIRDHVRKFAKESGFDYYDFAADFEAFLLNQGLLNNISIDSYRELLRQQKYCEISHDVLLATLDNSFSTSPTIGSACLDCLSKESELYSLSFDSLAINPTSYVVNLLTSLTPRQFEKRDTRLFFIYEINVLVTSCK